MLFLKVELKQNILKSAFVTADFFFRVSGTPVPNNDFRNNGIVTLVKIKKTVCFPVSRLFR